MENMKNILISVGSAIVVVVLAFVFFSPKQEQPIGATPGGDFYNLVQLLGGLVKGNVSATSTPADMTMKVGDINGYDTIIVTPTGAAASKTLTFFASSTARSWLPKAGMRQQTCFLNSTTTAATTLIFAGATGIDMQVATSTNNGGGAYDLTISAGGTACFEFIRKASTASTFDIEANLVEYEDGD